MLSGEDLKFDSLAMLSGTANIGTNITLSGDLTVKGQTREDKMTEFWKGFIIGPIICFLISIGIKTLGAFMEMWIRMIVKEVIKEDKV